MVVSQADPVRGTDVNDLCIWRGIALREWRRLLELRPPIDRRHWPKITALTASSIANSCAGWCENRIWGNAVDKLQLPPRPVFILGHWRSGTTLLHQLLARDPQFVAPTNAQCLYPHRMLLNDRFRARRRPLPATRPMDQMHLDWNDPQEDELAILLLTLRSPYLWTVLSDPEQLRGALRREEDEACDPRGWPLAWIKFLKKVCLRRPGCTLLLKSPSHALRLREIRRMFPDARFIHLMRNPYEVFVSTLRMRRALHHFNGFTTELGDLEQSVIETYQWLYQAYHLQRALFPEEQRCEVRYEDLVAAPIETCDRIYRNLQLGDFEPLRASLTQWLPEHRAYRPGDVSLSDEQRQRVAAAWAPAFDRYGYSTEVVAS